MGIDPDELLIFKNREEQKPSVARTEGKNDKSVAQERTVPVQEAVSVKKSETAKQNTSIPGSAAQIRSAKVASSVQEPKKHTESTSAVTTNSANEPDISRMTCINHPWRQAYALCEYCKRPFCYADMMPSNNKLYCLEDIDRATRMHLKHTEAPSRFIYITSIMFALCTILLVYLVYVPANYLAIAATSAGFSKALIGVALNYSITIADLFLAFLSFVAALLMLRRTSMSFGFGASVLALILILTSYEYLTSNAQNLYIILSVTLINMGILSVAKMDISGSINSRQSRMSLEGIEWPRPELF